MMDDKTRDDLARAIRAILFERGLGGSYVIWDGETEDNKNKWRRAANAAYADTQPIPLSAFRKIKSSIEQTKELRRVEYEKKAAECAPDAPNADAVS